MNTFLLILPLTLYKAMITFLLILHISEGSILDTRGTQEVKSHFISR